MKLIKLSLGLAAGALVLGAAAVAVTPAAVQAFSGAAAHAVLDVPALQGTPGPSTGPGPGIPHRGPQPLIEAAASVTGLSNQEVLTQLQSGQSLAQIAASKGKTADDVIQAARTLLQTRLKQAVTDGRLTQAQADTDLQEFDSSAQQFVNETMQGRDFGPRGDGGFGHGGPGFGRDGGSLVAAAASVTGLTAQEVLTLRQSGQSLAQIAESKGKTADDVIQAARTTLQTMLKQAVTDGRLTQAQADEELQEFDARAQQMVSATDVGGPSGRPRFNNPANPIVPTPTGGSSA